MTAITAPTEVSLCNMALGHLGISTPIQSMTDGTQQANVCSFWYPICLAETLKMAPWNFALTTLSPLVVDATVLPGWPYAYAYPNDCLQIIAVTTFAGQRLGPAFWANWWYPYPSMTYAIPKVPYKIAQSTATPGALAVFCDIMQTTTQPLYFFYTQNVTNPALFDALFQMALSYNIAWRIGGPLRVANAQKIQYCQASYEQSRLQAVAQALNEMQQDQERDSVSTMARW